MGDGRSKGRQQTFVGIETWNDWVVAAEKKSIYLTQRTPNGLLPAFEFTHLLPEKERFEILDISIFASNTVHACCSNAVPCVSVFVCIRKNQAIGLIFISNPTSVPQIMFLANLT